MPYFGQLEIDTKKQLLQVSTIELILLRASWNYDGQGGVREGIDFFFFPDDVYVNSRCLEDSNLSVVILQSQSRLGNGDIGINFERLSELISYLNNYSWSGNNCY